MKYCVLFALLFIGIDSKECSSLQRIFGSGCDDNPDIYLDVPKIIKRHGYPSEVHVIETDDGYILEVHRIAGNQKGQPGNQPVFLQHGLLGSSADWVVNEDQALAFYLADRGYDVWLGNVRGNLYSKGHVSLPLDSAQYWNFSWHEMAVHDLPAILYHISNTTNKPGEIIYIGHSMGTTMFFAFASSLPQAAKNVKLMIALAPVAYMTHLKSPIRYLAPFTDEEEWLMKHLGINQFLPSGKILEFLAYDCKLLKVEKKVCENIVFIFCGFDKEGFNQPMLELFLAHDPAGSSTKTVLHYAQEIKNGGRFQKWDYGPEGNMIAYHQLTPPAYKLENIKRPLYFLYSQNDWLASPIDVERLNRTINSMVGIHLIPDEKFDHIDFILGKNALKLVNEPVFNVMRNFTSD